MLANSILVTARMLTRRFAGVLLLCFALIGCAEPGPDRVHVSGNVTWKGQKVAAGFVTFSPDVRQGNSGPQGMAKIVDGRYDTRVNGGRPPVGGPMNIGIGGFDGLEINEDDPYGRALFSRQSLSIVIPEGSDAEIDLTVPESAR